MVAMGTKFSTLGYRALLGAFGAPRELYAQSEDHHYYGRVRCSTKVASWYIEHADCPSAETKAAIDLIWSEKDNQAELLNSIDYSGARVNITRTMHSKELKTIWT